AREPIPTPPARRPVWGLALAAGLLLSAMGYWLWQGRSGPPDPGPVSIAVLPFQNDSPDSSNVYVINGLMVSILDKLQQVEDLRVTSRTTVEAYRHRARTIPELAEALDVRYFVEGSGQKMGDQILLTVRLIDAQRDQQLWSRRYQRQTRDIFDLQLTVATQITREIQASITPEEQARMAKIPTDNLDAYDAYLRGLEAINQQSAEGLTEGLIHFERAIALDPDFAQAHAYIAITYYYTDLFQTEKQHGLQINTYADRALLLDPELPESLIAKAMFYLQDKQYPRAVEYLEKALDINPHSSWVHNTLSDIYATLLPNTEKYLQYALRGIRAAVAGQDSSTASTTYLHLANALAQNGFLDEARTYIDQSLRYDPGNLFARIVKTYIQLGKDGDLSRAQASMQQTLALDTTFLPTLQELAKLHYFQREYAQAWQYYAPFIRVKEQAQLDIYPGEDLKIAMVLSELGQDSAAQVYLERVQTFYEQENGLYQDAGLAGCYALRGENEPALAHLKAFAKLDGIQYWFVLFMPEDPILARLSGRPGYDQSMQQLADRFWTQHARLRAELTAEGLLVNPPGD
ncbi:MAG: AraC family transcriptional regulator, partial [Bacteroidetes bacterium]